MGPQDGHGATDAVYSRLEAAHRRNLRAHARNRVPGDPVRPFRIRGLRQPEQAQIERVRALRERRDAAEANTALAKLEEAARGTENVLPRILDCVEAYVTVGEIGNRLRKVWGEYRESSTM